MALGAQQHGAVTRLAPSPTGALHLGNARTFLINWAMARRAGWRIVLRIEDLDTPRTKRGAAAACIDTLRWLGLDWDQGPHTQADDLSAYAEAMRVLAARGCVFRSTLSRAEIERAASAPHAGEHEVRFPPSLRPAERSRTFDDTHADWRFATEPGVERFSDLFAGPVEADPSQSVGDFPVWTRRGQPTYQLAVVVDDSRHGVTHVVRGDDLLDSAARQLRLIAELGLERPTYAHLPLVVGPDGRRLAKRHGDSRLDRYRGAGVPATRLIGLIARWSGVEPGAGGRMSARQFAEAFDLARVPRTPVVFDEEDERWLLDGLTLP